MDPKFSGFKGSTSGFILDNNELFLNSDQYSNLANQSLVPSPHLDLLNTISANSDVNLSSLVPSTTLSSDGGSFVQTSSWSPEGESSSPTDDGDSSDPVLKYISQMLLEENMEGKPCMFFDPLALQDTERLLYQVLHEEYPAFLAQPQFQVNSNVDNPDSNISRNSTDFDSNGGSSASTSSSTATGNFVDSHWIGDVGEYSPSLLQAPLPCNLPFHSNLQQSTLQFSVNLPNNLPKIGDRLTASSMSELLVQNMFSDRESILQFKKGLEEASKFLPSNNQLPINLDAKKFTVRQKEEVLIAMVNQEEREQSPDVSKGKKNHEREEIDLEEGRSNKQSAVYIEEGELSELFDKVLLYHGNNELAACAVNEAVWHGENETLQQHGQSSGSNSEKSRAKKQVKKKETVDLRTLLILCAQAACADDHRTAADLLKQIRQHASPLGDGSQRLAHFFANGLEARLAGNGTGIQDFYSVVASKKTTAADLLKAYKVYLSACPFKKLPIFFANKMISKVAEKASALHIIDFGILYGFQWPILIQYLSMRPGGPPKLRITGIELPQRGFRPAEGVEETGRRLARYCERFNVPFEYNPIAAQKWENIHIEDLKIDRNEVLAVNCLFRFKNLLDETVQVNSPRNTVLSLIRKTNPDIFVHSTVNGSYNSPFFLTRFREALFHFSSLFDVFDATLPREEPERLMFEREFYGREAMNVVACEGLERVERPETYKQWQMRIMRAGFKQLPLDQELMNKLRTKLKAWYHKDFVIDEDNHWFLQGWKGRILYASSCWVPT